MESPVRGEHSFKKVSLFRVFVPVGLGTKRDPERLVYWYYDESGELVAYYDPIVGPPDAMCMPCEGCARCRWCRFWRRLAIWAAACRYWLACIRLPWK